MKKPKMRTNAAEDAFCGRVDGEMTDIDGDLATHFDLSRTSKRNAVSNAMKEKLTGISFREFQPKNAQ